MEIPLRTVICQKIVDAQSTPLLALTRRDVWLPAIKGKATAVIGMRRSGKTSLLWQILADRVANGTPRDGLFYFSFEDCCLKCVRGYGFTEYLRFLPLPMGLAFVFDTVSIRFF